MCKAPKPKPIKVEVPEVLRNPFLDEARSDAGVVNALRTGRNSLRVPLSTGLGIGFSGRNASAGRSLTAGPRGNARKATGGGRAGSIPTISGRPGSGVSGGGGGGGASGNNFNQILK